MKRTGNLFEQIVERENLRRAFAKALRGKRDRSDARRFSSHLDWQLRTMADGLRQGTFPLGRCEQFVIHDPKVRTITAPCFEERVLHHAIMNVCEPVFERWLIHDTYACRTGRGRVAAIERAQHFAGRYAFFLKMDVRKYFDSISHDILLSCLERLFRDARLLDLLERVVDKWYPIRGLEDVVLSPRRGSNISAQGRAQRRSREAPPWVTVPTPQQP